MFELFFKYPFEAFAKGDVVLLGRWPVWLLCVLLLAGAAAFAWPLVRHRHVRPPSHRDLALQTATLAMLLLMLWQPALSVATLAPAAEHRGRCRGRLAQYGGSGRRRFAQGSGCPDVLNRIKDLDKKFQVRLYRAGGGLDRLDRPIN